MAIAQRTATTVESSSATSLTGTLPSGTAVGDVSIAYFGSQSPPTTPPPAWTPLFTPIASGAAMAAYLMSWAGTPSAPSASWATAGRSTVIVQTFTGVHATPLDAAVSTVSSGGTAAQSVVVPGVTTATAGAVLVSGAMADAGGATSPWTNPASMTLIARADPVANTGLSIGMAFEDVPAAGATGSRTWTQLSASLAAAGWLVALRPAGIAPPQAVPFTFTPPRARFRAANW